MSYFLGKIVVACIDIVKRGECGRDQTQFDDGFGALLFSLYAEGYLLQNKHRAAPASRMRKSRRRYFDEA